MNCGTCHGHGTLDTGADAQEILCPVCDGEGFLLEERPGGRWNGNGWEPDGFRVTCERCDGLGTLDVDDLTDRELDDLGLTLEEAA